jgi:hypothetical protein
MMLRRRPARATSYAENEQFGEAVGDQALDQVEG